MSSVRKVFYSHLKRSILMERLAENDPIFVPSPFTVGQWDLRLQHGGAAAALLARSIEIAGMERGYPHVVQLTTSMFRPIPMVNLRLETQVHREGRKAVHLQSSLRCAENGTEYFRTVGCCLSHRPIDDVVQPPAEAIPAPPTWPGQQLALPRHIYKNDACFARAFEVNIASGKFGQGPTEVWVKQNTELVEGEKPSGLQKAVAVAELTNGLSYYVDVFDYSFLNTTTSITFVRPPDFNEEWIGLRPRTVLNPNIGTGIATSEMFDRAGRFIGTVSQSLVLQSRIQTPSS